MKILLVHNTYQHPGGEDVVFRAECDLLSNAGHHVSTYTRTNLEIADYSWLKRVGSGPRTIWSWESKKELAERIAREKPDVAHFHNTFPLISPSAFMACREAGVPVVQTLHNPRLLCPSATLYRDGKLCEECIETKSLWPAVRHACYRGSRAQTATVVAMLLTHRFLGTWAGSVGRFIASTNFYARKFIASGLPAHKIVVKPHFVSRRHQAFSRLGEYALFVGRLSPEKGLRTLLAAWEKLPQVPLKIRGNGPQEEEVQKAIAASQGKIVRVPRLTEENLVALFQRARFLVWPSEGFYETFGLVAIEAFACGIPVIASNIGSMAEIVTDRVTGLCFQSGDPTDLASKVDWAWNHPAEMQAMGAAARLEYESKYTPERNYESLLNIYNAAIQSRAQESRKQPCSVTDTALSS
jgi:glycosyltransferase involved in cell wall biosynthesis